MTPWKRRRKKHGLLNKNKN